MNVLPADACVLSSKRSAEVARRATVNVIKVVDPCELDYADLWRVNRVEFVSLS